MAFQGLGAQGNYAAAGKAAADEAVKIFRAQRDSSPDYGKMAQDAANIRSKEKVAMNEIQAAVTARGIKVNADLEASKQKVDGEMALKAGKRKAGVLAAGGKLFSQAGEHLGNEYEYRKPGEGNEELVEMQAAAQASADD